MSKLHEAPDEIFEFWMRCEEEGFLPSIDDFKEEFGDKHEEWDHIFPQIRHELWGEVEDFQFQEFDPMKEAGHKLSDFE